MQVTVERGQGLELRMTVGLEPERIDAAVEMRLRELARSAKMAGFRPGKVPIKILRQRYGGQMRQEVFVDLMNESYAQALAQEGLHPLGDPQIEPQVDESAERYAFTAVFEVLPELELRALEGKTIKRPVAEVTDADLDAMLMRLRDQCKTWKPVERAARPGDRLRISFTGTQNGEPFEGGSANDRKIELGLGGMIPGFEEGLEGMRAGDERRLELQYPGSYPAEHLKGKPVLFDVSVREVAEPVLPEVDADFVKGFGFADGDLDRFRLDVRQDMERALKERIEARVKNQAMDLLLEANQVEPPNVLVEREIEKLKQQMRQQAGGGNLELSEDLLREQARRRVALSLILTEVVRANDIKVDPDRVREAVEDMASTYEQPQQVIRYYYADEERLAPVKGVTLENQVVDWVLSQVTVVDEAATFEELSALPSVR
jgi:trigger factor